MSKTSEALEDRERPARPVHPSCLYLTFLDPSAVVVSRLTYASTAWCGFVTASNIQRVDAFLRRSQRCGFCPPNPSDFSEQLTECDDRLFNRIRRHNGNTSCTPFMPLSDVSRPVGSRSVKADVRSGVGIISGGRGGKFMGLGTIGTKVSHWAPGAKPR